MDLPIPQRAVFTALRSLCAVLVPGKLGLGFVRLLRGRDVGEVHPSTTMSIGFPLLFTFQLET